MFHRVALIGLGLMGSSVARALRRAGTVDEVVGFDRSAETRKTALGLGFLDRAAVSAAEAAQGADLVVLCTPVGAMGAVAEEIGPALAPGAVVTDVGSVKAAVLAAMAPHIPKGAHLIPGHPIAGAETSGPEAGFAEMFDGRWWLLTPPPGADKATVARLSALWEAVGARVAVMTAARHDRVLATVSHLPQLLAYGLVDVAKDFENEIEADVLALTGAGFRSFTRIAGSDPTMWRDVFLANRDASLEILERFSDHLANIKDAIERGDGEELFAVFARAQAVRRGLDGPQPDLARADPTETVADAPDFRPRKTAKSL